MKASYISSNPMFAGFSTEEWNRYFTKKHTINAQPCSFLIQELTSLKQNDPIQFNQSIRALDIGCGTGNESKYLLQTGWKVDAIDALESVQQYFTDSIPSPNFNLIISDITNPETWESLSTNYDLIIAINILPLLNDINKIKTIINNIYQKLQPHGLFIVSFFGTNHGYNGTRDIAFTTMQEAQSLLSQFSIQNSETLQKYHDGGNGATNTETHYISARK
jgi:tellurite methyltransferase